MTAMHGEAWHLTQLRTLEGLLRAKGYQTQLLEKSTGIAYHALLARLDMSGKRSPLEMAFSFYPADPAEIKHSQLLQYYIELPLVLDADGLSRLVELLPDLNGKTVLGHFGVAAGRQAINYRYVQTLPAEQPVSDATVADVLMLVGYTPALFLDILDGVASGQLSVEAARAEIAARYAANSAAG